MTDEPPEDDPRRVPPPPPPPGPTPGGPPAGATARRAAGSRPVRPATRLRASASGRPTAGVRCATPVRAAVRLRSTTAGRSRQLRSATAGWLRTATGLRSAARLRASTWLCGGHRRQVRLSGYGATRAARQTPGGPRRPRNTRRLAPAPISRRSTRSIGASWARACSRSSSPSSATTRRARVPPSSRSPKPFGLGTDSSAGLLRSLPCWRGRYWRRPFWARSRAVPPAGDDGRFRIATVSVIVALLVLPGNVPHGTGVSNGRGVGYWLSLIVIVIGLVLCLIRMRDTAPAGRTPAAYAGNPGRGARSVAMPAAAGPPPGPLPTRPSPPPAGPPGRPPGASPNPPPG